METQLRWKLSPSVPVAEFKFADAESVMDKDGELTFINPFKAYESNPCVVLGTEKSEGKRGIFSAKYYVWSFTDISGKEIKRETAWLDYLTEEIEIDVEAWIPFPEIFKKEEQ